MTGTVLLMAIALADTAAAALPVSDASPHWRGLVVVLVPPIGDDVMRNALARVSGELAAAPFKTVTTPIDPDGDVMSQVESAGTEQAATAAFAIVRDRDPGSRRVTIWVSNRVSGTTTMQRMQVEGGDVDRAAARLAVETVELVRASLAELWPARPAPAIAPPVIVEERPPSERPARLALAVSVGLMRDFGDAPDFWAPQIAASYGRPAGIGVRLSASGFGPGAGLSAMGANARVERAMATLGLVRSFRADRIVQPTIGIAVGVNHLSVHGTAPAPEQERNTAAFSALASASAGLALALTSRVAVLIEADVLMAWPTQKVRIYDTYVATFDRPNLFTHAGLLAAF
jgi:hypothetical protein